MALDKKSQDQQSYYSSPWGRHECQHFMEIHPIVQTDVSTWRVPTHRLATIICCSPWRYILVLPTVSMRTSFSFSLPPSPTINVHICLCDRCLKIFLPPTILCLQAWPHPFILPLPYSPLTSTAALCPSVVLPLALILPLLLPHPPYSMSQQ